MIDAKTTAALLLASLAAIYLVVTAPAPLPDGETVQAARVGVPVRTLLDAANTANAAARKVFTERIVSRGQEAGLVFAEDWLRPEREAGPLPALFLRSVAAQLQEQRSPLALFLGSDSPINPSNGFKGEQVRSFIVLKQDRKPRYFEMADLGIQVALYADVAVAAGCVSCHNGHPKSPKHDWVLGDVMGAATWTYPRSTMSDRDLRIGVAQVYDAIERAYRAYLDKSRRFAEPPSIGSGWPEKGQRRLPDADTFMAAVKEASAMAILNIAVLLQ